MAQGIDASTILRAIDTASTPEQWDETLRRYGAAAMNDLNLLMALHNAAVALSTKDPTVSQGITRWLGELQDQRSPGRIERMLLLARSDEDIQRLLEAHRPLVTHELGMNALSEVRQCPPAARLFRRCCCLRSASLSCTAWS